MSEGEGVEVQMQDSVQDGWMDGWNEWMVHDRLAARCIICGTLEKEREASSVPEIYQPLAHRPIDPPATCFSARFRLARLVRSDRPHLDRSRPASTAAGTSVYRRHS